MNELLSKYGRRVNKMAENIRDGREHAPELQETFTELRQEHSSIDLAAFFWLNIETFPQLTSELLELMEQLGVNNYLESIRYRAVALTEYQNRYKWLDDKATTQEALDRRGTPSREALTATKQHIIEELQQYDLFTLVFDFYLTTTTRSRYLNVYSNDPTDYTFSLANQEFLDLCLAAVNEKRKTIGLDETLGAYFATRAAATAENDKTEPGMKPKFMHYMYELRDIFPDIQELFQVKVKEIQQHVQDITEVKRQLQLLDAKRPRRYRRDDYNEEESALLHELEIQYDRLFNILESYHPLLLKEFLQEDEKRISEMRAELSLAEDIHNTVHTITKEKEQQ